MADDPHPVAEPSASERDRELRLLETIARDVRWILYVVVFVGGLYALFFLWTLAMLIYQV